MANYLQLNFTDALIYEYSKDPKEGFEEHTNTKGAISYRRNLNKGLYGKITKVEKRDSNFGDQISISVVESDGNVNYLSIPLFDAKGNLSIYAEGFMVNLKGLVLGEAYRIYPYAIETEKGYTNRGVSIKKAGLGSMTVTDQIEKYKPSYTDKEGNEVVGDIPKVTWVKKFGKNTPNNDAKNEFLFNKFEEFIGGIPEPQEQEKPKQKTQTVTEEDELPF